MTLHYNQTNNSINGMHDNGSVVVAYTYKSDVVFCGSAYLKEYVSQITVFDLETLFPGRGQQLLEAISQLKFQFKSEGAKVAAGEPLLVVSGDPQALNIVHTAISAYIGGQTAVSTAANKFVACTDPNNIFAFLGLRRDEDGEMGERDYAAWKGGFKAGANINIAVLRNKFRYIHNTMPVVGTIAHDWISSQTAIHRNVLKLGQLEQYLKALEISTDQYNALKELPDADLNDYVAFRAYITAVNDVEKKLANPGSKGVVLLVDTTDTIKGVRSAIQAAIDSGRAITGIRLDTTPEKYVEEAAEMLQQAKALYPDIFAKVKIYCTDGIDFKTLEKINNKYKAMHDKNANNNRSDINLVYGIGSSIANEPALKLDVNQIDVDLELEKSEKFCMAEEAVDTKGYMSVVSKDEYNNVQVPVDFYALSQADFLNCINKRLEAVGIAGIKQRTSQLTFRHRPGTPNYLLIAGLEQALRSLENFKFDDHFINMMRDLGLSYTEAEYAELFAGKKLDLSFSCVAEGSAMAPYAPILSVTGNPAHVLLVESFLLSTIGSMSSVATAAHELVQNVIYTQDELHGFSPQMRNKVRFSFGIKDLNDFSNNKQKIIPSFIYNPDSEKGLSTKRSYAAYLGGFSGTTMLSKHGINIPSLELGINFVDYKKLPKEQRSHYQTVCIDINDVEISTLLYLRNKEYCIQIRGDFDAKMIKDLRDKLVHVGIKLSKVQFIIREPLVSTENAKGIVYKLGAIKLQHQQDAALLEYCIKAAGNTEPGVKNSIPGFDQRIVLLKKHGIAVARMMIDLNLLENNGNDLQDLVLNTIKMNEPELYYSYDQMRSDGTPIALGAYALGDVMQYELEFCTRFEPNLKSAQETLDEAKNLAHESCANGMHKLPLLMERTMYNKLCSLLSGEAMQHIRDVPRAKLANNMS